MTNLKDMIRDVGTEAFYNSRLKRTRLKRTRLKRTTEATAIMFLVMFLVNMLKAIPLYYIWNSIMPNILNANKITFLESLGLVLLYYLFIELK